MLSRAVASMRAHLTLIPPRRVPVNVSQNQGFSSLRFSNQQRPVLRPPPISVVSQRNIHPALILVVRQFARLLAILTGRGFRKWWSNLPSSKRKHFIGRLRDNKTKVSIGVATLGATGSIYIYTHLQTTPITNRLRFIAFNSKQLEEINEFTREMQYEMVKDHLLPANHVFVRRVKNITERLLAANRDIEEVFSRNWSVCVINSPEANAFVGPSGQICVYSGMLGICENDNQLGSVLAHEISHAILNHGAELLSYTHLLDFFIILVLAAIWAIMPTDGIAAVTHWFFNHVCDLILHLPYSRQLETEADIVGLELAAKACFDIRESSAFWSKMSLMRELKGDEPIPEFLSTHPDNQKRSETLDALMIEAMQKRIECRCPPLPRRDPRVAVEDLKQQIESARKWRRTIEKEGLYLSR